MCLFSPALQAAIPFADVSGATAAWDVVLRGENFDPGNDQQAVSNPGADLVGTTNDATLYVIYDDNSTPLDESDDEIAFRIRVGGGNSQGNFSSFIWMGVDVDLDGDLDVYVTIDGNGKAGVQFAGNVQVYSAGAGQNTSPSTSDASNPSIAQALADGSTFSFVPVSNVIDPGTTLDINADGITDRFVSYKVSWQTLKNHINYIGGSAAGTPRPLTNSTIGPDTGNVVDIGLSKDTPVAFTLSSSTQGNNTNSDVAGYDNKLDDLSVSFQDQGAFSPPLSFSNIAPQITSDGGGDSALLQLDEESVATVTDVDATDANSDALLFSIVAAAESPVDSVDAALFSIDSATGVLSLNALPDYESPIDNGANNSYQVVVRVTDARGATDTQAITLTIVDVVEDAVPPTVSIQNVPSLTNAAFTATIQFSEAVTGFVIGDIAAGNATLSAFAAVDADTYTVLVTPTADGAFTLDIAAGVAEDAASNGNTIATQVGGTFDGTAPTVSIQNVPATTNAAFTATIQFSEAVTGFAVGDIIAANASLSSFVAVDADTYTVLVTPAADGAFTLDIAAGVAVDSASNGNTIATQASGSFDGGAPSVSILNVPATTNAAFTATIQFSEAVTGFAVGDIAAANASLSSFAAVDADTYTVLVTPTADGAFTLNVAAGVAVDGASNGNTIATQAGGTFDGTAPTVAIQNVPATTNAAFTATIQFSEAVTGFAVGDIVAANASLSSFVAVDADTYTVLVTPTADGAFTLNIAAGVAVDGASNGNTIATQAGGSFDGTAPTVTIQNVPATTNAAFTATIQFSEAVTGFTVGDINAGNATLSSFVAVDADTYTVLVTPTIDGAFTLDIAAGVAVDSASNGNTIATQAGGSFDGGAPSVSIQNVPATTNAVFTATIQFSEAVTGFTSGDITSGNAVLSAFATVDADTYTVLVTPSADGPFTLDIGAAVAQDGVGNDNTAATQAGGTFDGTAPTVSIQNVPATTNAAFTATIQFSEAVTGFAVGDINAGNATLSSFVAVDADTYTVLVTPTADGAFTLNIAAGVAVDGASNGNTIATQAGGSFDGGAPSVSIQNVPATTNAAFTATIQFSEAVTGFTVGDITTGNAALSAFATVDADTYTVLVTPSADGPFTLDIGAAIAQDGVGNDNTAATQAGGTFDGTAPTVAIQNVPATTNAAFTATIQFSEAVTGFAVGDIAASNATLSSFVAVDADTYTVLVTPTADGAFTLNVAAGVAADAAGNGNTIATQADGSFDGGAPTVSILNVPATTNAAFTATIQFSEAVTGFTVGDITSGNAALSAFATVDADTYTVLVTPSADGPFTLDVGAAVAQDGVGNDNTAATQAGATFDGTAPTVAIQNVPATTNAAFTATIQFSEAVTGFAVGDIAASNATLSSFVAVDADTYTVLVTPTADGAFTLNIAAGVAVDGASNGNTIATQAGGSFDGGAPSVSIQNVPATTNAAFTATIQFSEAVTGFTVGDITSGNAALSAFATVDADTYTVLVTPSADGPFTLDIGAAVAQDGVGNDNTAATQAGGTFDGTAPTVMIQNVPATSNAAFAATIQFSEAVTGFAVGDINAGNATLSSFVAVDADTYTVLVTPTADGAFTLNIAAGVAVDGASNGNTIATQAGGTFDGTAPTVAIQNVPATTNAAFTATIQFSEAVTGFAVGDISAGNASLSSFVAVDADTYTVLVTPTIDGAFTLDIAAGVAVDGASNGNTIAAQAGGSFDGTAPTVTIQNVPATTNVAFAATIQFSEAVTGFAVGDISAGNATLSSFVAVDADTYTVLVTPTVDGAFTLNVAAGVAVDGASNGNTIATQAGGSFDGGLPSVAILNVPSLTNAAFTATIQFNEAVTGFVVGDISAGNAALSNFVAVDADTYTVLVTPAADGLFTLNVAAAVAQDGVGNNNTAATQAGGTFDGTAPAVPVISSISDDTAVTTDGVTSDNRIVFSGTSEFNSTVEVFINGVSIGTALTSPIGIWSLDHSAIGLADATYAVTASATDLAGNDSFLSPAFTLVVDTVAPAAPTLLQDGAMLNDASPSLSGTAEANSSVTVTVDGVDYVTSANGAGSWTLTVTGPLDEGPFPVTVTSRDLAGNATQASVNIEIDTIAPVAPVIVSISDDTGTAGDGVTSDNTLIFAGTGEAGAEIELFIGGASIGSVTIAGTGSWQFDYTGTELADGAVVLTAQVADAAGNTGPASTPFPVTVDTQTPALPGLDQNGQTLNDNTPVLSGAAEPASQVTVTLGSGEVLQATADGSGVWSVTVTQSLAEGAVSVAVLSVDAAGNSSATFNGEITIDIEISETFSSLVVVPGTLSADGVATATVTILVRDTLNQPLAGLTINAATTLGSLSAVADNGNGSYSAVLTAPVVSGNALVSAVSGADAIGQQSVIFTPADSDGDGLGNDDEDYNGDGDVTNDDIDGDGTPNYLDDDDDGDGKTTDEEDVNGDGNPLNDDSDGDGIPDFLDADDNSADGTNDSDGDGIPDTVECPGGIPCPDSDGDGLPDYMDGDDDNDGIPSAVEGALRDSDGDGTADYLDEDDDNDGLLTRNEDDDLDGDGDPSTNPGPDLDADGIPAYLDPNDSSPGVGDTDGDGIPDDVECQAGGRCEDSDNDGLPDFNDPDDDNDNILTINEDVDQDGDPTNDDSDGDGTPNYLDRDDDNDGINSDIEGTGDLDGDGIPNHLDRDNSGAIDGSGDSDGDGLSDTFECPTGIPCRDNDGDGIPDYLDEDDDNDSVLTRDEDVNEDGNPDNDDVDGDGTPNYLDVDDDNDGVTTVLEGTGDSDGDGIPDHLDPSAGDSDGDGLGDGIECPDGVPCPDSDGDGIPNFMDPDDDGDGVLTVDEDINGDNDPRNDDSDGDGTPDYLDTDDDNDGQSTLSEGVADADADGIPNHLDRDNSGAIDGSGDSDGDGLSDAFECPTGVPCRDSDADGIPDYLDEDDDNDGVLTRDEDVNADGNPDNDDTDRDGTPDYLDTDDDGDGVTTLAEGTGDSDGDGIPDHLDPSAGDSDGDGIGDGAECPTGIPCRDSDGDGIADYLDEDDDNDGVLTRDEDANADGNRTNDDSDGDGTPDYLDNDDDGDGVPTLVEGNGDLDGDGIPDYLDRDSNNSAGTLDGSGDSDGDGISDLAECPSAVPCPDANGDGTPDYMQAAGGGKVSTAISGAGSGGVWLLLAGLLSGLRRRAAWVLLLLAPMVWADDEVRFYAGAGLGASWLDPERGGTPFRMDDDTGNGWQALAGWRWRENISAEVFWADLGEAKLTNRNTLVSGDLEYRVVGALANWYPRQQSWRGAHTWSWYLQTGLSNIENDGSIPVNEQRSVQVSIGLGAEYELRNRWMTRLSLQSHNRDAGFVSLSLFKAFGGRGAETVAPPPVVAEPQADPQPVQEPVVAVLPPDDDADGIENSADQCPATPAGMSVNEQGCSVLDVRLEGVQFASGSAAITESSRAVLDKVVEALRSFPLARVEIGAHTDAQGSEAFNQRLSQQRAESVTSYLVERGVESVRLEARGYGENQPIADNSDAAGRAQNRRVEMRLLADVTPSEEP